MVDWNNKCSCYKSGSPFDANWRRERAMVVGWMVEGEEVGRHALWTHQKERLSIDSHYYNWTDCPCNRNVIWWRVIWPFGQLVPFEFKGCISLRLHSIWHSYLIQSCLTIQIVFYFGNIWIFKILLNKI